MNKIPETQRLFFALWPDDALRAALAQRTRALLPARARAVAPENLHLTLAFLGATDGATRTCLERTVDELRCARFDLALDHGGYFPRPQVYWLGASRVPPELLELVAGLQHAQRRCGGEPERRPFQVHLTLARKVRRAPPSAEVAALHWPVDRFVLVSSRTLPEGPQYRLERTWMLQPQ